MTTDEDRLTDAEAEEAIEFGSGTPIQVVVGPEPKSLLAVRLPAEDIERLRLRAERENVNVSQLVRAWISRGLEDEEVPAEVEAALATIRRYTHAE